MPPFLHYYGKNTGKISSFSGKIIALIIAYSPGICYTVTNHTPGGVYD